eukprot:758184-Hanusia_phi.AAC.14
MCLCCLKERQGDNLKEKLLEALTLPESSMAPTCRSSTPPSWTFTSTVKSSLMEALAMMSRVKQLLGPMQQKTSFGRRTCCSRSDTARRQRAEACLVYC